MDSIHVAIAIAIILVVLTFLLSKKFKKSLKVTLLMGLSDSGKTSIFCRIVFNKPKKCVTSLKENDASVEDLQIRLLDLPGAERLRNRLWEQYRAKANHVMYVIDSTTLDSKIGSVSEYLYQILTDDIIYKNGVRVTIVCHKQDLDEAKDKDEIRRLVEKEMNVIKDTRKGQLGKTSEEVENDYLATRFDSKPISLDSLSIEFIATSINNLDQFIKNIL